MKSVSKLFIFGVTFLALTASAYAQSPREQLQQLTAQLQKAPTDNALRERIIRLGAEIKPAPAVPEEANRFFVRGNVFQKEAKDASGYELAISAYRDALRVAPWWGDAYFNLAVALESANKFDEAIASIKLYMASVLGGSAEAREAQNRIYAIEAKSEMASKQAAARAAAERAEVAKFAWILGDWSFRAGGVFPQPPERVHFVRRGDTIIDSNEKLYFQGTIRANGDIQWERKWGSDHCGLKGQWHAVKVNFSGDRQMATILFPIVGLRCEIRYGEESSAELKRN